MNPSRRALLLGLSAAPLLVREALAMAGRPVAPGFHQLEGEVWLNRQPVRPGMAVNPGDVVSTGRDGMAVFVVERDAFLLRANSEVEIAASGAGIRTLRILSGKLLSVFGKGEKRFSLPTATLGIRGTAVYVEAEPARSYICTCYGEVEIQALADANVRETVKTRHHDAPRFVHAASRGALIQPAPVFNHTDAELIMLEALVGRVPPFYDPWGAGAAY